MVKCTRKIGIAQKRCTNVKGKAKKKKCLKRVMCGPKKKAKKRAKKRKYTVRHTVRKRKRKKRK